MRNPPLEVVASWPTPNYIDPVHRGPTLLIVEIIIASLAVSFVTTRMIVRIVKVNKCGLDDLLMVVATIFGLGVTVCVILAAQKYGWNIHVWDLTTAQAEKGRKVSLAAQTLFLFASGLAKISILVAYLRIAPKNSWLRRCSYALIGVVTFLIFAFLVILYTQCRPVPAYWLLTGAKNCAPEGPRVLAQGISTAITDFLVCILPLPTLIRLQLPLSQRIALVVLFSFGLLVVFASCMRAYWSHYVTDKTYDVTWQGFYLWIWTAVEANLGVICGSIPSLRPLFKTVFPSQSSRYYNSSSGYNNSSSARTGLNSTRRGSRAWPDPLHRSSKGLRIDDEHILVESGVYIERHEKSSDSPTSTIEMNAWCEGERRPGMKMTYWRR